MIDLSTERNIVFIGGPNGSGKSTFAYELLKSHELIYISADDIVRRYHRSLDNFWNIYKEQADLWYLYYNGSDYFEEFAYNVKGSLQILNEELFRTFNHKVKYDG